MPKDHHHHHHAHHVSFHKRENLKWKITEFSNFDLNINLSMLNFNSNFYV